MKILLTALVALIVAAPAAAAPPANDNRADAQTLPTFPSTAHGTTVEATTERLAPQLSKWGRGQANARGGLRAAPARTRLPRERSSPASRRPDSSRQSFGSTVAPSPASRRSPAGRPKREAR